MSRFVLRSCSEHSLLRSSLCLRWHQQVYRCSAAKGSHASHTIISAASSINSARLLHNSAYRYRSGRDAPSEPPPTDFNELNVLGDVPAPSTSVDVCMYDGFGLNSGITITGGNGALLVNGEAFAWRPWEAKGSMELVNKKGQFEIPKEAFGVFDLLWPRPGTFPRLFFLSLLNLSKYFGPPRVWIVTLNVPSLRASSCLTP